MFVRNLRRVAGAMLTGWFVISLALGLASCGQIVVKSDSQPAGDRRVTAEVVEVSPPEAIQALRPALENYQPQVAILSPQPNEMLQDNTVALKLRVEDYPLFKDSELEMGPHLHVILDDQPYRALYDLTQPLTLEDLAPGTHTLRVFASRPWQESFKSEGAYAQTTFHIFTKTQNNNPSPGLPLLTYSRPQGSYGAEPIMLDFYLTNAPLHMVAQERSDDEILDWQIRCTVNGSTFMIDRWQPVYLKGFKPGKNWIQLELINEKGLIRNTFNDTVRLVTYKPGGKDTLSRLTSGQLKAAEARRIVDPSYMAVTPLPSTTLLPPGSTSTSPETTQTIPGSGNVPHSSSQVLVEA